MAAPRVYSVRFLAGAGAGWRYYTVPTGYRAVVRSISSAVWDPNPSWQSVSIAGVSVWFDETQAPHTCRVVDLRQVAYAGEQLGGYCAAASASICVSGYLFQDTGGAGELQPDAVGEDPPQPDPSLIVSQR